MTWQKALLFKFGLTIGAAIGGTIYQYISTGDVDWYKIVFVSCFVLLLLWRAFGAEEVARKDVWSQSAGGWVMIDAPTERYLRFSVY